MLKKILALILLCPMALFGQNIEKNNLQSNDLVSSFIKLSTQHLYDTANYYLSMYDYETALICYNLIINTPVKDSEIEQLKMKVDVFNRMAFIYNNLCDFSTAYGLLIKGLLICEKINYTIFQSKIYNNIGNIYERFKKYDLAKYYYVMALQLCPDSVVIVSILNNLGVAERLLGNRDSAFYFFDKALPLSKKNNERALNSIYHNIALNYLDNKQYDSARYYYRMSYEDARKKNILEKEALALSNLSSLFLAINKIDSALYYIDLSNTIAKDNRFLNILTDNYLNLSKIEELHGRNTKALAYYKIYANLKDSVYSIDKFGEINQLQRLYEISKTNQQIEQLYIEQQIKEKTNHYLKTIQIITSGILLIVSGALVVFFFQKRSLNFANKTLVDKNLEIMDLLKKFSEPKEEKDKKSSLTDNAQNDLLNKISTVMENMEIICDSEFSIIKLAEIVDYNHRYVSEVINKSFNKNFRSYLNSKRIREAQRLFSEIDFQKFTIEFVAQQVGFKSLNAFYEAFKDVTGVNPGFYLKSIREQKSA